MTVINKKLEDLIDQIRPKMIRLRSEAPGRDLIIQISPKDFDEIFGMRIDGVPVTISLDVPDGDPQVKVVGIPGPS